MTFFGVLMDDTHDYAIQEIKFLAKMIGEPVTDEQAEKILEGAKNRLAKKIIEGDSNIQPTGFFKDLK